MTLRQQLIKSFIGVGALHLLSIPIALLISVVLARTLGPESFGQYAFIMALLSLLSLPVVGGVSQLLTREVAGYSHTKEWSLYRGVVRSAFVWVVLISLLVLAAFVVAGPILGLIPAEGKWALLGIVVLLVPFNGFNAVRNGTIKGLGFPAFAELPTQFIQPLILLAAFVTMIFVGELTVRASIWVHVFGGAVTFIIASILFLKIRPQESLARKPMYQSKMWLVALLPLTLITLVSTFNTQIGIVMLGLMGTDEAVAALRVGERCAQFVVLSLMLVNMVISPHIVKTYREGNTQRLQQLSRQSARGALLLALPIGLLLIVLGKPVINLVFGEEYVDIAYMPMVILVCGQLFNVAMGSVGILLIMCGHEKLTLLGQLAGLGTTVACALVLIPVFQALGAAIAVAAGLVVWNSVMGYAVAKYLRIRPGIL